MKVDHKLENRQKAEELEAGIQLLTEKLYEITHRDKKDEIEVMICYSYLGDKCVVSLGGENFINKVIDEIKRDVQNLYREVRKLVEDNNQNSATSNSN